MASRRTRIVISLVLTVIVVFLSPMVSKNLYMTVSQRKNALNNNVVQSQQQQPKPTVQATPDNKQNEAEKTNITAGQRYYKSLVSPASTNILITGTDTSGWNFDTIMILSIDKANQQIKLISLPRDIYIKYSQEVLTSLKKAKPAWFKEKGIWKINAVPTIGNAIGYKKDEGRFGKSYIDFLCDTLNELFGIYIDDYIYIKANGVRKIVDYFGGVTVYVPVLMNYSDPTQDFEVYIEKGTHHLNGKQAEGYLRFRQGYDSNGVFRQYGDMFRKENQSRFMKAFISQHVTLSNIGRLSAIADVITRNVQSSVSGWNDIVEYGALAEEAVQNAYTIDSAEIECTDKTINGSSYVILKTAANGNASK